MAEIKAGGLKRNIGKSVSVWRIKPRPKKRAYFLEGNLGHELKHNFFYVISPEEDDGLILKIRDRIEIPYKGGLFRLYEVVKL